MTLEEIKIILDRVQSLAPADASNFKMLLIVECVEKVAYYGLTALVTLLLGRRIIQGILTAIRDSRPTGEPPPGK